MAPAGPAMAAADLAVRQRPASATCAGRPRSAGPGKPVRQRAAKVMASELGGALDATKPLQLPELPLVQQRQQHGLHGAMLDGLAADLHHRTALNIGPVAAHPPGYHCDCWWLSLYGAVCIRR
ncbi:unnamed protein product, partial [Prorocentrum cordatum]